MLVLVSLLDPDVSSDGHAWIQKALHGHCGERLNSADSILLIDLADSRFDGMRHLLREAFGRLGRPEEVRSGRVSELTPRERQVLCLSAEGHSYESIAETLEISLNTVRYHMRRLHMKLKVHNRAAAVHRARELGLV